MATKEAFKLELDIQQAVNSIGTLRTAVKGLIAVIAVDQIVDFGKSIVQAGKEMQTVRNQLSLVTKGSADLDRVLSTLTQTAIQNRTSFAATVELYTKLRISTDALGISEERVIDVTSKLSQALQVAGADAATTNSVVRQFGQAMASGTVRGDEFNSLVEGLGPALAIMAQETGITVGKLRDMSQNGELTAEVMVQLLENSTALTAAFSDMNPTLDQVQTAFEDAFNRALRKLDETIGLTSKLTGLLEGATRVLDKLAGTEGALVNLNLDQIFANVQEGSLSAAKALDEVKSRIAAANAEVANTRGLALLREGFKQNVSEMKAMVVILEEIAGLQKVRSEETKARLEAEKEQQKQINEILKAQGFSIKEIEAVTKTLAKVDFSTPYEKAKARLAEAQASLKKLLDTQKALQAEGLPTDKFVDLDGAVKTAREAVSKLRGEVQRLTELTGFDKFYTELITAANKSAQEFEFAQQAANKLIQELLDGKITAEAFAYAMESVRSVLKEVTDDGDKITDAVRDYKRSLEEAISDTQFDLDSLNMNALEKEIASLERKMRRDLKRQIDELRKAQTPQNAAAIEQQIEEITRATEDAIKRQKELVQASNQEQRSFTYGWKKAFEEYVLDATNAAKRAENLFRKATSGMEDLIVNFAKTGKFEWKNFVASMLEELLRAQIQTIFAQLMGSMTDTVSSSGSALSSIFGGGGNQGGGISDILSGIGGIFGIGGGGGEKGSSANNPLYVMDVGGGGGGMFGGEGILGGGGGAGQPQGQSGGIWQGIKDFGSSVWQGVKDVGSGIWDAVTGFGGAIGNTVSNIASGIGDFFGGGSGGGGGGNFVSDIIGGIGDFFGGFFANGGMLGAGKFGIAGENGPEFISGPAQITPMAGSANVTYNINAVDAASFKTLLAQDPGFIYGLTLQGSKSVPARR